MTTATSPKNPLRGLNKIMKSFDIRSYLTAKRGLVDRTLDQVLPASDEFPPQLHKAMRYCLFAGGKRLRPILCLAAYEAVGGNPDSIINAACALELIHTYTLIHDDLPSMDNDDYRRGCLATHKVFGEAVAILAGDALQAEAFKQLATGLKNRHYKDAVAIDVIREVAQACGSQGLIAGQVVDLQSEGKLIDKDLLDYMHIHKTGLLITASVSVGALLGNGRQDEIRRLKEYSRAIGLTFQITDDLLDVLGSTENLGKEVGSDEKRGKATYPGILGTNEAIKMQGVLYRQAIDALQPFDEKAEPLREIAKVIIERNR